MRRNRALIASRSRSRDPANADGRPGLAGPVGTQAGRPSRWSAAIATPTKIVPRMLRPRAGGGAAAGAGSGFPASPARAAGVGSSSSPGLAPLRKRRSIPLRRFRGDAPRPDRPRNDRGRSRQSLADGGGDLCRAKRRSPADQSDGLPRVLSEPDALPPPIDEPPFDVFVSYAHADNRAGLDRPPLTRSLKRPTSRTIRSWRLLTTTSLLWKQSWDGRKKPSASCGWHIPSVYVALGPIIPELKTAAAGCSPTIPPSRTRPSDVVCRCSSAKAPGSLRHFDRLAAVEGIDRIWRTSADGNAFLERILPVVLDDVRIDDVKHRIERTKHWKAECAYLDDNVAHLTSIDKVLHEEVQHWKVNVASILAVIADRIRGAGLDGIEAEF